MLQIEKQLSTTTPDDTIFAWASLQKVTSVRLDWMLPLIKIIVIAFFSVHLCYGLHGCLWTMFSTYAFCHSTAQFIKMVTPLFQIHFAQFIIWKFQIVVQSMLTSWNHLVHPVSQMLTRNFAAYSAANAISNKSLVFNCYFNKWVPRIILRSTTFSGNEVPTTFSFGTRHSFFIHHCWMKFFHKVGMKHTRTLHRHFWVTLLLIRTKKP